MSNSDTIRIAYVPRLYETVEPHLDSNSIHGYYLQHQDAFVDAGITLVLNGDPSDCQIAWIGSYVWDENQALYQDLPLIQEHVVDSTWLNKNARSVLQKDNVIALTKGGVLRDLSLYNEACYEDSYHSRLILEQAESGDQLTTDKRQLKLDGHELLKLIPSPGFLHIGRHNGFFKWARQNMELAVGGGDRPYSCNFVGSVKFKHDSLSRHRKLAADIVQRVDHSLYIGAQSRKSENWVNKAEYLNGLRKSKVCVSPWGYGERCHRDYEAILSGCVLVKPCSSHVVMYPDMFNPAENYYVPCKLDFSDLKEVVEEINDNWDAYESMRISSYKLLMDSIKPEYAITYICNEIKSRYFHYLNSSSVTDMARLAAGS